MALTEMVIMPGEDYQAICDSVRAKTGATELLKSGEVSKAIDGIETGGGIDTSSDTPAEAGHIIEGRVAYVNGEKVTGEMKAMSGLSALTEANEDSSVMSNDDGSKSLLLSGKYSGTTTRYVEPDTSLYILMEDANDKMSMFGDATLGDVVRGKTFTSSAGLAVAGSIEPKTASDVTSSGATVTIPAGYYASSVSKSVSTTTQATPTISVSATGLITASATQTAGYVSAGTKSATKQLAVQTEQTITPSTSNKTISSGLYLTGVQTIQGDANLKAENIKSGVSIFGVSGLFEGSTGDSEPVLQEKTATPTTSTQTITPDSQYDGLSKVTINAMPTTTQVTPSISVNSSGLITATATQSAGYVSAGTKSATKQLTTQAAQTITPGTSDKTIASGRYLTGTQTIKGDANLIAENIKDGVTIFGVAGTLSASSGSSEGQYCWKKYPVSNGYEVTTKSLGTTKPSDCGSASYSSYTITDEGYFQLASGTSTLTYYYLPTGAKNGKTKYIYLKAWKYAASGSYYLYSKLTLSDTPTQTIGDLVGYVVSDVSDTYPSDGDGGDGYWYTLVS